jgi:DNA-binding response OmpR family regulator
MTTAPAASVPVSVDDRVTVLVVDGDESRRYASIHRLRPCVDRLLDAASGELALYVVATAAVDLVVTDLDLPGMSGEDLLTELRDRGGPPVVAVLPGRATRRRVAWLDAGGADCISPTDDPRTLNARFHALLRRR